MTCLSELICAVYVDGELPPEETRDVERHLSECARCRALVAALRGENRIIGSALDELATLAASSIPAPRPAVVLGAAAVVGNHRPTGTWGVIVTALVVGAGLAAAAGLTGWGDLTGRPAGDWIGLAVEAGLFVLLNAAALEWMLATVAVVTMAGLALAGGLYLVRSPARAVLMLALAMGGVTAVVAPPAEALEVRRGRDVVVAAAETLDGTLVAAGESVRVDGTVQGDLIVAAAHVDVRGTIRGDLVAVARAVDVVGSVEGSVYAAAGSLTLRGRVGRGLYAANRSTVLAAGSGVGGDVALAGRSVSLHGQVDRGASIFAHDAELHGGIGRDVRFRGEWIAVKGPARVQGAIRADVRQASAVTVDGAASVTGPVLTRVAARAAAWYGEPRVWFWAATRFFGAALLGWIGLLLTPTLIVASAESVRSWKRSLGWGVLALVTGPVAILLLAVTLVGIPLALILLGLYLVGLYAAKLVVGLALGRTLLRPRGSPRRDALWALVVGLAVITLATAVPWLVGGAIRLVVTCLGAGALAWRLAQTAGLVRGSAA
jgi:anti-sigma factor RsiW